MFIQVERFYSLNYYRSGVVQTCFTTIDQLLFMKLYMYMNICRYVYKTWLIFPPHCPECLFCPIYLTAIITKIYTFLG